jgi:hypothetical protein
MASGAGSRERWWNSVCIPPQARSDPRYPVHKIVSFDYGGRHFLTLTVDLGLEGMKIENPLSLPADEHLNFKLVLGAKCIWPRGRIISTSPLSHSQIVSEVRFTELSKQDYRLLQGYLAALQEVPKPWGMVSAGRKANSESDRSEDAEE